MKLKSEFLNVVASSNMKNSKLQSSPINSQRMICLTKVHYDEFTS